MNLMKKQMSAFGVIIVLFIIITVITTFQFHSVNNEYSHMIDDRSKKLQLVTYSIMETYKEQLAIRDYMLTGEQEIYDQYLEARGRFQKNIEDLKEITNNERAFTLIDQLVAEEEKYFQIVESTSQITDEKEKEQLLQTSGKEAAQLRQSMEEASRALLFYQQDNMIESSKQLTNKTEKTTTLILVFCVLSIMIGMIVSIWMSRHITKRLQMIATSAEEVANGILTANEIEIKSKDEIGQLARTFRKMKDNLRTIIQQVNESSEQLAASSEELLASAEETTAGTNQVATSISQVAHDVELQGKSTKESAQGIKEITTGISRMSENVSIVATSAEEATKEANQGNENIVRVVKQINDISHANTETNSVIKELETRSSEIGKIIEVITGIADQTNLLALNAAIESARAGEHGKGFAVVADEVRKLAEQSRESAKQISNIIKYIQLDTKKAAQLMENGTNEVTEGMSLVKETGEMFEQILLSVERVNAQAQELSAISEEISAGVTQVNV